MNGALACRYKSATEIIDALGGDASVARHINASRANVVSQWKRNNMIPAQYFGALLRMADELGVELAADDLVIVFDRTPDIKSEAA